MVTPDDNGWLPTTSHAVYANMTSDDPWITSDDPGNTFKTRTSIMAIILTKYQVHMEVKILTILLTQGLKLTQTKYPNLTQTPNPNQT